MASFTPQYLTEIGSKIFAAAGFPVAEAEAVAELLVEANCSGHDSHGVIRIPQYLEMMERGDIKPGAEIEIVRQTPAATILDGHWGLGQVVMSRGVEIAAEKAAKGGMAVVGVRRANHVGRLGSYVDSLARRGMIGLLYVNGTPTCRMAPWGGTESRLGTNPLAKGFPTASGEPLVLDMTTTVVAEGKVRIQRNRDEPAPDGWLLDAEGKPTNDPNLLYGTPPGSIQPLGGAAGHKGYGLNVAVELLAGALSGSGCLGKERQFSNGVLLIALDVAHFLPLEEYYSEVEDFIAFVKSSPPAAGVEEILLPGEIEAKTRQARREGVFVEDETWGQIAACAGQLGLTLEQG